MRLNHIYLQNKVSSHRIITTLWTTNHARRLRSISFERCPLRLYLVLALSRISHPLSICWELIFNTDNCTFGSANSSTNNIFVVFPKWRYFPNVCPVFIQSSVILIFADKTWLKFSVLIKIIVSSNFHK